MDVKVNDEKATMQQVIHLLSRGYVKYAVTQRPIKKRDRFEKIDEKLLSRYPALSLNKHQRARRKRRGLLNARMLRLDHLQVILATEGEDDQELVAGERLQDARERVLKLPLVAAGDVRFVRTDESWTVRLTEDAWRALKARLLEAPTGQDLVQRWRAEVEGELPSFAGFHRDKRKLRNAVVRARKELHTTDLPISQVRPSFKVFEGTEAATRAG